MNLTKVHVQHKEVYRVGREDGTFLGMVHRNEGEDGWHVTLPGHSSSHGIFWLDLDHATEFLKMYDNWGCR